MTGYLYKGDPTSKIIDRIKVTVKDEGSGVVSFRYDPGGEVLAQEAPPSGRPRDSYGLFGKRTSVGAWERFQRSGSLVTAWTGDTYVLVELPR